MTLHDRIMAVPVKKRAGGFDSPTELRSAIFVLKDAADLATEADELMAEMEKTMQKALTALEVAQYAYGVGGISGVIEELSELRGKVNEQ